jgi:hypothetical protein
MNKISDVIINQPFGLGDIIFLQGLVEKLRQDHTIVFPVADEYAWVSYYLKRDNVHFPRRSEVAINYEDTTMREDYLPLRFSTQILRGLSPHDYSHDHTVMEDKYSLMKEHYRIWRDFPINRNLKKEKELVSYLGLDGDDYVFINETYGSDSVGRGLINIQEVSKKTVRLSIIDGYTLFDWISVLEKCKQFHTVDTSVVWLIDFLQLPGKKVVYPRSLNTQSLKSVISKDWIFV